MPPLVFELRIVDTEFSTVLLYFHVKRLITNLK